MARLDDRGGRDAAGHGPYHRPDADLVPLRSLADWTLNDGEPDIRGWEVQTVGGRDLGTIRDLLVDRAAGEVVALDLDLAGGDRRARVPIRAVQIDRAARVVRMDSADLTGGELDHRLDDTRADLPVDRSLRRDLADARPVDRDGDLVDARPLHRDDDLAPDERRPLDADTVRRADGVEETVVERRPVVYEEVVVRRVAENDSDAAERPRDPDPGR